MSCKPKICAGDLRHTISIQRRALANAAPGSAEPVHTYQTVLSPRAAIKTRTGVSEWSRVEIAGERATYEMTIRWTPVAFDVRDRVRDAAGNLYRILAVENVDERDDWLKLHCARMGDEDQPAAR
ncbi:MAG: head-tail adaptor protein [Hyphomicrobium sp.]|nr:head-tail adaptor protein [Hyphomicrobium sp.]